MTPNPQANIHHKCRELILLLQINLNHFPRHEKYGLCQEIRQCVYGVLSLLDAFAHYPSDTGIPIGNLLSQLSALVYLNPLDHFVKRELGIARYVRYVDDFILFDLDRDQAHQLRERIEAWLADCLRLELSKWSIHPVKRGVNFVGFRTWRKTRFVRKHSLYKFSRAVRLGKVKSIVSALGHARHTASFARMARRCMENKTILASLPPVIQLSFGELDAAA